MAAAALSGSMPGGGVRRSRRPRRQVSAPHRYRDADTTASERAQLLAAIRNSKVVTTREAKVDIAPMPIFYPTLKEFADPMAYIRSIEPQGSKFGVVKVVPPTGWSPPLQIIPNDGLSRTFDTKLQDVHKLQQGKPLAEGKAYTVEGYRKMADTLLKTKFPQFGHDRVRSPSTQDVLKWARMPECVGPSPSVEPGQVQPKPTTVRADATYATGDELIHAIEDEFWRVVETSPYEVQVEYGSDIPSSAHISGFDHTKMDPKADYNAQKEFLAFKRKQGSETIPVDFSSREYYQNCGWNAHNLPFAKGSVLRHLPDLINGVNVPWLYMGMLFAAFAWHVEDDYLFSASYMHFGAPKIWYGVPRSGAAALERTMKSQVHARFAETPDLLYHLVTVMCPNVLKRAGVPVYRGVHNPGEFMVTFPRGYHSGVSTGFNCAEAVNFALASWIKIGRECQNRYRLYARPSILSFDLLMCRLARHGEERSVTECEALMVELADTAHFEKGLREAIVEAGVVTSAYLGWKAASRFDCAVCRQPCQLSAVVCDCSKKRVACLEHYEQLCECPSKSKCFVSYIRMSTLDCLIDRVTRRLERLQRGSVKRSAPQHAPKASVKRQRPLAQSPHASESDASVGSTGAVNVLDGFAIFSGESAQALQEVAAPLSCDLCGVPVPAHPKSVASAPRCANCVKFVQDQAQQLRRKQKK